MPNLDSRIDQAYSELKSTCGGVRNDYFGVVYLEDEYDVPKEKAINQTAFGGNDYGIDGFHFDLERKNLYLFQFKYSVSHTQFKTSLQRLIDIGIERIFTNPQGDPHINPLILQLRSCMIENRSLIEDVHIRFVFIGDPQEAERSQVLDRLREDLENKKYLIDKFFRNKEVSLVVEFRSAVGRVGSVVEQTESYTYPLHMDEVLKQEGPDGEVMYVGFVRLMDLDAMFCAVGDRFFERNIRYGLGEGEVVNRAISRTLKSILLDEKENPGIFCFNHNGITLFAQEFEFKEGEYHITAPRLLNGAQTITTFRGFFEKNRDNPRVEKQKDTLKELRVLCKIITQATPPFVTTVTINNNRQNPVEPWNLHANDMIQLELQDKFRNELGIYYERQEKAFGRMTMEEMEEEGITEAKAIELVKLAQTFLVSDGNIQRLSNLRTVFEDEKLYSQVFSNSRLQIDSRLVVLCYKIPLRLRKCLKEIEAKGLNKYWFIYRARNLMWALLCQGILNDDNLDSYAEKYGRQMTMPADFTSYLVRIATSRCRLIIADLIKEESYTEKVRDENFNFLRTNQAYKQCMDIGYNRWGWIEKKLRRGAS